MFYFIACFPFILILRDFLFFFATLAPVKGAIWRAWGIESFCLLINKHSRSSKKKKKKTSCPYLAFHPFSFTLTWKTSHLSWDKVSADQFMIDRKTVVTSIVLHSNPSDNHQCEWNVPICLCCCYLESNGLGRLLSLFAFTVLIAFVFICTGQEFSITRRVRNALYYLFTHYWWKLRLLTMV